MLFVVDVWNEEGGLMNDFTGRVRPDERKPPKGEQLCALVL
jgi:intron-binding protein aquarius